MWWQSGNIVETIARFGIQDADFDPRILAIPTVSPIRALSSNARSNEALFAEIVEKTAELGVPRLVEADAVPARYFVQRGRGAAVVAWDAVFWVTDEESEVELGKEISGENGRVAGLAFGRIWVRWGVFAISCRDRAKLGSVGSHTALVVYKGGCDLGRFALRWHPVVGHVLDENAFSLWNL